MKRVLVLLITLALIAGMAGCGQVIEFQVRDWYDLDAMRDRLANPHILVNDLDSTTPGYGELAGPNANGGRGWKPIIRDTTGFSGKFDGQGYQIRDLFISRPDEALVGLFGGVHNKGFIGNVGIVNADVTGGLRTGGLVGLNEGSLSNTHCTGTVAGAQAVGGLVGTNRGSVESSYSTSSVLGSSQTGGLIGNNEVWGEVINSYSTGSVTGGSEVGGLVGRNSPGSVVHNSCSTGSVSGDEYVGGLVGHNAYGSVGFGIAIGSITNSYSTGSVTASLRVGGLVGDNWGTVGNSYSTGNVTGDQSVGGLVGYNAYAGEDSEVASGTVFDSFSTGSITGAMHVGGLVGQKLDGTVSNSFWDTETGGQTTSAGGTGKTPAEMQDINTFTDTATEGLDEPWDIIAITDPDTRNSGYIWNIVDGQTYPFLSWQAVS